MVIQHNISAINAHRQLGINNNNVSKNLEKLSSGFRINRAGDDAAGLAISEKMRGQIRGLSMAEQNTSHAINLIQTAEGGLQETHAILQRMRELAVQSANGTYDNDVDRYNLEKEYQALMDEIDRIADSTHYNGINLLDGSLGLGNYGTALAPDSLAWTAAGAGAYIGGGTLPTIGTATVPQANIDGSNAKLTTYEINLVYNATDGTIDVANSFAVDGDGDRYTLSLVGNALQVIDTSSDRHFTMALNPANLTFDFAKYNVDNAGDEVVFGGGSITFEVEVTNISSGTEQATVTAPTSVEVTRAPLTVPTEGLTFQIGANGTLDQRVTLFVEHMGSNWIGTMDTAFKMITETDGKQNTNTYRQEYWVVRQGASIRDTHIGGTNGSQSTARDTAIQVIDDAINAVSSTRADLGALQNRLEHTMNNLGVTKENLTAAESTIRDVDMAKEMMEYTKNSILVQASQAMLAQANMLPQGVLQLLG